MTHEERPEPSFETLLREAVAHAPVALLHIDLDGVVRFAAGKALAVPAEQIVGRPLADLAQSPEQVERVHRALAGEPANDVSLWGGRYWQVQYSPLHHEGALSGFVAVITDVTGQVHAEQHLAAALAHLHAVVEAAGEAMVVADARGVITLANARCAQLFGAPVELGTPLRDLLNTGAERVLDEQLARRAAGHHDRYELELRNPTGVTRWVLVSASPLLGQSGDYLGSVAQVTDITEQKALEQRLQTAALTDPLTGVANRASLTDRLARALARRSTGLTAVLFCDVDELKTVNDQHGHHVGDQLLRHIADRITSTVRPADTVARYGGDEFVVVCEDLHNPAEALHLADRIRTAAAAPMPDSDLGGPTLSIGVATAPPHRSPDELVAAADAAAYQAKRAGRNRARLHEPPDGAPAGAR